MIVAIIPAYNEEKTIAEVIERVKKQNVLPIVVDNNSKDKTYEIAKKLTITLKEEKKGKGYAVRRGIEYALEKFRNLEAIILIDADLQHLPEEIPKFLEKLKHYDFVQGCRDWRKVPLRHKAANFLWRTVFNILFGANVKDLGNGFIAMKLHVAKKIVKELGGGYIIEARMLKECIKNNFKIGYVRNTIVYEKKVSKILRGLKVTFGILFYIVKEGIKYRF